MIKRLMAAILMAICVGTGNATDAGVWIRIDASTFPDRNSANLLKSKLEHAAYDANIGVADDNALFITATISIVSEEIIEGGMQKIRHVTYELNLLAENPILGIKFGARSITLKGYGNSNVKAIGEALKTFSPANKMLSDFMKSTVSKANEYYENHFDEILSKARTIAASGDYEEAIALLWGLPTDKTNGQVVYSEIENMYNLIQKSECGRLLSNARSAFAVKNYYEAVEWLRAIDGNSPCYSEAKQLNERIAKSLAEDQKLAMQYEEAERARVARSIENDKRRQHSLQMSMIKSISSIATAYLNSRQNSVLYVL